MSTARIILGLAGLALLGSIIWAMGASNFGAAFGMIIAEPWGIVTLIDLYTGFIFASIIIAAVERGRAAILWIVPVYFLGNIVTVLWLILRWRRVVDTLRG